MPVIFDLDDTLHDHHSACAAAARAIFERYVPACSQIDSSAFVELWFALIQKYYTLWEQGKMTLRQQRRVRVQEAFSYVGMHVGEDEADEIVGEYMEYYASQWRLFPDVLPCLDKLRGTPLAVLSNGEEKQQLAKLEKLRIAHYFEVVVTSEQFGIAKPDPGIFAEGCRRLGCSADQCWYVGDLFEVDACGAQDAGMRAVWLNRAGEPAPAAISAEVHVISSLTQLPELVRSSPAARTRP
jgi:putative hydrolase of the HAD superfamily